MENSSTKNRRKKQSVTMSEVAKIACVSPSTVSLFLRKPSAVSPSASAAISKAIETLNYVPNLIAGGLASATSRAVSVVVPSVRNAFFAETVSAMQEALKKQRLQLILGHTEYDEQEEEDLVRMALSWSPAAIVLTGLTHSSGTRKLLSQVSIPVIEIWELGGQQIDAAVGFYHDQVGMAMAQHLIEQGRRHLAFFGARMHQDHRAKQRCSGFVRAAKSAGVEVMVFQHSDTSSAEIGSMLLADALRLYQNIDGVACSNDHIALGVIFGCERLNIAVPKQLAVVGFGDLSFSSACNPSLTTVRLSGDLIGREAARLIDERLQGKKTEKFQTIDTRFTLKHRRSS